MSRHKNFVATNLSFFAAPEKCRNINFLSRQIFLFSVLPLCHDILCYVATFFMGFFSSFVATRFSFVATEFLTVACCCCLDRPFLCLSCTAGTELCCDRL